MVRQKGISLDPRILDQVVGSYVQKNGAVTSDVGASEPALTAVVSFEAADDETASEIARAHPGLHYGAMIELRHWLPPAPRS
ncbi:hypothetical protein [Terriglobus albidus]|uniref:hypothetical protein n=1 Tax=Terriglobus albidus TaxID=1592106 RepID=UPI0021DFD92A|nr:hypothetical protein [Terriglobus albidus]